MGVARVIFVGACGWGLGASVERLFGVLSCYGSGRALGRHITGAVLPVVCRLASSALTVSTSIFGCHFVSCYCSVFHALGLTYPFSSSGSVPPGLEVVCVFWSNVSIFRCSPLVGGVSIKVRVLHIVLVSYGVRSPVLPL